MKNLHPKHNSNFLGSQGIAIALGEVGAKVFVSWIFSAGTHGGGNSNIFYLHPEPWGDDPILTSIFLAKGLVQPPTRKPLMADFDATREFLAIEKRYTGGSNFSEVCGEPWRICCIMYFCWQWYLYFRLIDYVMTMYLIFWNSRCIVYAYIYLQV